MIEKLEKNWRQFKESAPGHRFQDRYRRRRQDEKGHIIKRVVLITLGTIIAVGSLALSPLPGPGWGTVFIGLMILGGELLPAARFLDWAEVRLRELGRFIGEVWQASMLGKVTVVVAAVILVAVSGYVAYYFLFGS
jgi:uncharacterized protein (TIGR02611 family)